jgi:hypothetical protein
MAVDVTAATDDERRLVCSAAATAVRLLVRCGISPRRPLHVEVTSEVRHPLRHGVILGFFDAKRERVLVTREANVPALVKGTPYPALPQREFYKSLIVHEVVHAAMHQNLKRPAFTHAAYEYSAYTLQIESLAANERDNFLKAFDQTAVKVDATPFTDLILFFDPYVFAARAYQHFKSSPDGCVHLRALLSGEAPSLPHCHSADRPGARRRRPDVVELTNIGDVLEGHARRWPEKVGARDLDRQMTFGLWHQRACRLANALIGIGLAKGDRVCILAYNCLEWLEIYAATSMAGLVAVPINFRLVAPEIRYIAEDCAAKAFIVQDALRHALEPVRGDLPIPAANFITFGGHRRRPGYRDYEDLIANASDAPPRIGVGAGDPWTLMYTSGTTGNPKGAVRSHGSSALLSLVTDVEMGLGRRDGALLVMPMCHANSLFFFGAFTYCGAPCTIYSRRSFDPEHLLRTLAEGGATFTSLVPTHYSMMFDLPATVRSRHNVDAVTKLMISSAPARRDTKLAIMDCSGIPACSSCTVRPKPAG